MCGGRRTIHRLATAIKLVQGVFSQVKDTMRSIHLPARSMPEYVIVKLKTWFHNPYLEPDGLQLE